MLRHALLACGVVTPVQRQDAMQVVGQVVESLANDVFRVRLDTGQLIAAHLSGVMRTKVVRILPGDRVRVEVSEFDLTRGRIVTRLQT